MREEVSVSLLHRRLFTVFLLYSVGSLCPNIFWMEEKNGKLIAIAKIFGTEEVLKTQFHHAKETKNAEIDALIYLGRRKS